MSHKLNNLLKEDDLDHVDVQLANLAAGQYGMSQEMARVITRHEDIGAYLGAVQERLVQFEQHDAAEWVGEAWNRIVANHTIIEQQDIINSGLNQAARTLIEQRNSAVFEKAEIDRAIAEGKSDDPALRTMLRQMEVESKYVVWTSIYETMCQMFPETDRGAINRMLNALSGGEAMTARQYEMLRVLLTEFTQMAAAS